MNPLIHGYSGSVPETSGKPYGTKKGTKEEASQSDLHPEAGVFESQTTQNSGPEIGRHMVTGATEQNGNHHNMVTGATEQNRNCHDTVTGVQREKVYGNEILTEATQKIGNCHDMTGIHEEVTYCSPRTSSGKQKKNRSSSQPQFCSENTRATIQVDPILLALQQLENNNNSANFHNNINRASKLPKSLITAMPTFDEKSEKIELFEDFFQTSVKILHQLTKDHRINYFHSLIMGVALQTFKSINGPTTKNLGKFLAFFRRKCLKLEPMTTMKHKFQTFDFHLAKQKLVDFLDEYDNLAKEAIVIAAHAVIEQLIYAKMPPHLKKLRNQAHLENGRYDQIIIHLEIENDLELNGLEATG